ncbi:E3 SUMO-protein ligase KIAA1586-like [Pantherophis guttatus]|uniref:E3 SUMO-protein ligase KIAA1586-like n=1 Tax=Pantherophis guttatus TaxID=94885 RepID=A0ABM3ZCW4_PANGU|nr:E3 SUMO-protein ligase KIAA1586-like [Pantherophis guttatus]
MNLICSESRSRLAVSNLTNLMTISIIGLPLPKWDPIPAVKKWFREHHHSANDPCIKCKKSGSEENVTGTATWKHLKAKDNSIMSKKGKEVTLTWPCLPGHQATPTGSPGHQATPNN